MKSSLELQVDGHTEYKDHKELFSKVWSKVLPMVFLGYLVDSDILERQDHQSRHKKAFGPV
jgi:hypothetical protein